MSHKVNPVGFRTGHFKQWKSRWFADDKKYKDYLIEDIRIRKYLMDKLSVAGITQVEIERLPKNMVVTLSVSRPGVVIGRGGKGIEDVKREIVDVVKKVRGSLPKDLKIDIDVREIRNPEMSSRLVAARIAFEMERRFPHRRSVTKAIERVMASGAKGVKVVLSGRIEGAEIARVEKYHEGAVPTQTLRGNIDYAQVPSLLKKGYVGVKVWIYKGEEEEED